MLDTGLASSYVQNQMDETPVDRVRRKRQELSEKIDRLQEERDRLETYLEVHEEFSRPPSRNVAGKEIDALCQMALRHADGPMTPAQLVETLKERFGAIIEGSNPARLVSTRMSTLPSVESTEEGWRLVPSSIALESEAYD